MPKNEISIRERLDPSAYLTFVTQSQIRLQSVRWLEQGEHDCQRRQV